MEHETVVKDQKKENIQRNAGTGAGHSFHTGNPDSNREGRGIFGKGRIYCNVY